jgi:hypothetical protein
MMNDKTLYNSITTLVSVFARNGVEDHVFSVTRGSCAARSVWLTVMHQVFDITHRATADPNYGITSRLAKVLNKKINE